MFNKSYEELADHYNTALLPARVLAPKDKAAVEGTVGALTRRLVSKLRNMSFFSLHELNKATRKEMDEFNKKPFRIYRCILQHQKNTQTLQLHIAV